MPQNSSQTAILMKEHWKNLFLNHLVDALSGTVGFFKYTKVAWTFSKLLASRDALSSLLVNAPLKLMLDKRASS